MDAARSEDIEPAEDGRGVEELLAALRHPDSHVRRAAVPALARSTDERALSALLDALQDPDAAVRSTAGAALGSLSFAVGGTATDRLEGRHSLGLLYRCEQDGEEQRLIFEPRLRPRCKAGHFMRRMRPPEDDTEYLERRG